MLNFFISIFTNWWFPELDSVASCFSAKLPDAVWIQPKLPAHPKFYPFFVKKLPHFLNLFSNQPTGPPARTKFCPPTKPWNQPAGLKSAPTGNTGFVCFVSEKRREFSNMYVCTYVADNPLSPFSAEIGVRQGLLLFRISNKIFHRKFGEIFFFDSQ